VDDKWGAHTFIHAQLSEGDNVKIRIGNLDVQTDKGLDVQFERNGADFESVPLTLMDGRVVELFADGTIQVWSPEEMLIETTIDEIVKVRLTVI